MSRRQKLVVAGNGMVGQKLLTHLVAGSATLDWDIVVVGEESRPAYDRVQLSSFFEGSTANDLSLVADGFFDDAPIRFLPGERVIDIDRANTVAFTDGEHLLP